MEFTEEEVVQKLNDLGYKNVPQHKLQEFMQDLGELIHHESMCGSTDISSRYSSDVDESSDSCDTLSLNNHNGVKRREAFSTEKLSVSNQKVAKDKENFEVNEDNALSFLSCSENDSQHSRRALRSNGNGGEVRRKVARRKDGKTRVFDETFSDMESSAADITLMEERLRNLPLTECQPKRRPYSAYSVTSRQSSGGGETQMTLPAFIRVPTSHPHTRGLRKTDPVNRYHQFKEQWKQAKIPGETKHSALRWQVRGQMLNYEIFEKPKHHHVNNDYVIPSEKKRQSLRWEVRTSMARI